MKVVIIGSGPTAVTVAKELRRLGYKDKIVVLSKEFFPPYSPPLMLDYLKSKGESDLIFWKGRNFFKELDICYLYNSPVISIDPKEQRVFTPVSKIEYDYLVIATGAELWSPITFECKKIDLIPYYDFKSLTSVNSLLEHIYKNRDVKKALIIGGGFIGIEVATTLNQLGLNVILVEKQSHLLPQMLSPKVSSFIEKKLIEKGVKIFLNSTAIAIRENNLSFELILEDGSTIDADVFIAATGIKPNISFLNGSGINIGSGIVVDEYLRTNIANIFAGGDVVETPNLISKNVYPHATFREAIKHGTIIASNILGYNIKNRGDVKVNSLYHFGIPLVAGGVQPDELKADDEILYLRNGNYKHVLLKNKKIIRFEFWGDIRGCGLITNYMEQQRDFDVFLYKAIR